MQGLGIWENRPSSINGTFFVAKEISPQALGEQRCMKCTAGNNTQIWACPEGSHFFAVERTPDGALAQAKIDSFLSRTLQGEHE